MSYCTVEDVILITGYSNADFSYLNEPMTYCQFSDMVSSIIEDISVQINRYCNVKTFEKHTISNELHTLTGYDSADYRMGFYSPARTGTQFFTESYADVVRTVFPREQPVISIDKVEVNRNVNYGQGPVWEEVHEYGKPYTDENGDERIGNDYVVIDKFETCQLYFVRNFPNFSKNNVRISYTAGYPADDDVWKALRSATRIAVTNVLNYKMRQQQIMMLRGSGVMDYASLFGLGDSYSYLTTDVRDILAKYRVPALPIDMYE